MTKRFSTTEDFIRWNERMIEKYHPTRYHHSSNLLLRWIEKLRTRRILSLLEPIQSDKILDVGCGSGDILELVLRGELWDIDISPRLAKEAQERLGSRARIFCGEAESVDKQLEGTTFDKIFCSEVLEHMQHPERTLRAMANLSTSGGKLIISVPNERLIDAVKSALDAIGLFRFLFGSSISRSMRHDWHLHLFERETLPELLRSSEIIAKKIYGIPFDFFPLGFVINAEKA